jgi:hypothetical protein
MPRYIPPDVTTWGALRQWAQHQPHLVPPVTLEYITNLQMLHCQQLMGIEARSQSGGQPMGMQEITRHNALVKTRGSTPEQQTTKMDLGSPGHLFAPPEIRNLPDSFTAEEKERWAKSLQALWGIVQQAGPEAEIHQAARVQIAEFSGTSRERLAILQGPHHLSASLIEIDNRAKEYLDKFPSSMVTTRPITSSGRIPANLKETPTNMDLENTSSRPAPKKKLIEGQVLETDMKIVDTDETCFHLVQLAGLCGMCGQDMTESPLEMAASQVPVSGSAVSLPQIHCLQCGDHPDGFRTKHELRRHQERQHSTKWICIVPEESSKSHPKTVLPLSECKECPQQKTYPKSYNAAAHLRRFHFRKDERGQLHQPGTTGAGWPPMAELKH